jgi:anaerobic magnesium-protoporphyrin IX monomethyl ester cyclase
VRVLLIRPPARHTVESEVPPAVEAENLSYPPLSLLSLAQFLRDHSAHEPHILDAQLDDLEDGEVERRIRDLAPDVVGITVFTVQLVDVIRTVEAARRAGVSKVVLGGPHCNDFPALARQLPGVDAVIKGEGQKPLATLLDAWSRGEVARGIPGVVAHADDPVPTEDVYFSNDLDDYPIIDRTQVDYRRYYDVMGKGGTFTTMITSRGCPFRCTFCNTPRHRYRTMTAPRICSELEACAALGIREIYFVDDTFNITNKRVVELCDEILRRGIRVSWTARFRVRGVDRVLLEKMKAAGCGRIQFGVEQGTDEGLLRFKKDVDLEMVENAFRLCREIGIQTVAYFMIGTPVERSHADVLDTIRYAVKLDPDFVMFNMLTPFPATTLFDEGIQGGVLSMEPWTRFMTAPDPSYKAQVWDEFLTRDELKELLDVAYRRFYFRPKFVARNLFQIRGRQDFVRKAKAGVRLLAGA